MEAEDRLTTVRLDEEAVDESSYDDRHEIEEALSNRVSLEVFCTFNCTLKFSSIDRFTCAEAFGPSELRMSMLIVGGNGFGMGFSTGFVRPSFISCT